MIETTNQIWIFMDLLWIYGRFMVDLYGFIFLDLYGFMLIYY